MAASDAGKYVGSELELFSAVHNWKNYWKRYVRSFIRGDVLEVGAGIGSNTRLLAECAGTRWVCLEPDAALCEDMRRYVGDTVVQKPPEVVCGSLSAMTGQLFDTVIYIDVLEHIEDDRGELARVVALLRPGGRVVVLSPAHNLLFSPFDAAIGHFRRYDRGMLRKIAPPGVIEEAMIYLDCAGLLLSLANRVMLRKSMPTKTQLAIWDHWAIPVSRILDPCFRHALGKTIIAVWHKPGAWQVDGS